MGPTAPPTDPGLEALKERLARLTRWDLGRFKPGYLRRRLEARRRALGLDSWDAYARALDADPSELERLRARLTIHVTEFFRDPDVWSHLMRAVLPGLLERAARRPTRELRLWSAGCSTGEEAYSLALLALEGARAGGFAVAPKVLASDVDEGALAAAGRGSWPEADLAPLPEAWREAWFRREGGSLVAGAALRRAVRFRRLDLFSSPPPRGLDVLLCRNVMIYFSRETQQRLLASFHHALDAEGVLVTGKTETILGPARSRFRCLSATARVFGRA